MNIWPVFLVVLLSNSLFAKWTSEEDLNYLYLYNNSDVTVETDGSYEETIEYELKILKDQAAKDQGIQLIPFDSESSKVKIISAYTINQGKKSKVDLTKVVEESLSDNKKGFTSYKALKIAYPKVKVGSILYLKFNRKIMKPSIKGHYSQAYNFGSLVYEKKSRVKYISKIPLYYNKLDSEEILDVKESKSGELYNLEINLRKPVLKIPRGEHYSLIEDSDLTLIEVSTHTDWSFMEQGLFKSYSKVIDEKIPNVFAPILTSAKNQKSKVDKVQKIVEGVINKLNYVGYWNTSHGKIRPRTLETIGKTLHGDCKDFTVLTIALLKKLGIKANPAFVYRAERGFGIFPRILSPSLSSFNHVIVAIEDEKETIWVDPTNPYAFVGALTDVSKRKSYILKQGNKKLSYIEQNKKNEDNLSMNTKFKFLKGKRLSVDGNIRMQGIFARPYIGLETKIGKEKIDQAILKAVSPELTPVTWNVSGSDFKTKRLRPLELKFNFTAKNDFSKVDDHYEYSFMSQLPYVYKLGHEHRKTTLYLGGPLEMTKTIFLEKAKVVNDQSADCSLESKWVDFSREIDSSTEGIQIVEKFKMHETVVLKEDFVKDEYSVFTSNLSECMNASLEFTLDQKFKRKDIVAEYLVDGKPNFNKLEESYNRRKIKDVMYVSKKLMERFPNLAKPYYYFGIATRSNGYHSGDKFDLGSLKVAKKFISKAREMEPDNIMFMYSLMSVARKLKDEKTVLEIIKEVETKYADRTMGMLLLADYYMEENKRDYGAKLLLTVESEKKDVPPRYKQIMISQLIDYYRNKGDTQLAKQYFEKEIDIAQNKSWPYHNYSIYLLGLGEYDRALEMGLKAIEDNPFGAANYNLAKVYRKMGGVKFKENDIKKAEEYFAISLSYYKLPMTYADLGDMALLQQKIDEAKKYYRLGIEVDPGYPQNYAGLIRSSTNKKEVVASIEALNLSNSKKSRIFASACQRDLTKDNVEEKLKFCVKALEFDDENLRVYSTLARKRVFDLKELTSEEVKVLVEKYLKVALKKNKKKYTAEAYYLKGYLLHFKANNGRSVASANEARKFYQKAVRINPVYKSYVEGQLKQLNNIIGQ